MKPKETVPDGISIVSMPYDSPDAARLIDGLQDEYVRIYGARDGTPVDAGQVAPPRGDFAVGYVESIPIAIGGWRLHDDGRGELKRMHVAEAHRGSGYSRTMLQWLERSAAAAGVSIMVLETNQQHPPP